jgi:hypothetical protein
VTLGLRVTEEQEQAGLDKSLHGESLEGAGSLGGGEEEASIHNVIVVAETVKRPESKYACTEKVDDAQVYPTSGKKLMKTPDEIHAI